MPEEDGLGWNRLEQAGICLVIIFFKITHRPLFVLLGHFFWVGGIWGIWCPLSSADNTTLWLSSSALSTPTCSCWRSSWPSSTVSRFTRWILHNASNNWYYTLYRIPHTGHTAVHTTPHTTVHTALLRLDDTTPHFTRHYKLQMVNSTLQQTMHTTHYKLHSAHCILRTSR